MITPVIITNPSSADNHSHINSICLATYIYVCTPLAFPFSPDFAPRPRGRIFHDYSQLECPGSTRVVSGTRRTSKSISHSETEPSSWGVCSNSIRYGIRNITQSLLQRSVSWQPSQSRSIIYMAIRP